MEIHRLIGNFIPVDKKGPGSAAKQEAAAQAKRDGETLNILKMLHALPSSSKDKTDK